MHSSEIYKQLDTNPNTDPNHTYNIIINEINQAKTNMFCFLKLKVETNIIKLMLICFITKHYTVIVMLCGFCHLHYLMLSSLLYAQ